MNLKKVVEPKELKAFMKALQNEHANDPRVNWDSFIVWSGNQLPKYLWNAWKDDLKSEGFTWQSFLKILRLRTDIVLQWFHDMILWDDFVRQSADLLGSQLAKQLNEKLEKKNELKRAIPQDFFVKVPIYGTANAGSPTVVAEQNLEGYLPVSKRVANSKKTFAVKVSGDSMNLAELRGKRVDDGDYVLVNPEAELHQGDKVLAVIDGLATIKNFYREGKRIKLMPSSTSLEYKPIYLEEGDDFVVNGKLVDVIKKR